MKLVTMALLIVATGASLSSPAAAERILLKGGYELVGDILKSDNDAVIVDIGCTVLRLARTDIIQIKDHTDPSDHSASAGLANNGTTSAETTTGEETAAEMTTPGIATEAVDPSGQAAADQWQLYRTAELPYTTIEQNTSRFGQAVVMVTSPGGQGSGFVISPDGFLITNYHVIAHETLIKVVVFERNDTGFQQKHYKKVRIVALNPFVDLALLKIEDATSALDHVYLGSVDRIDTGQDVFAIGNPLGLTRTVSQGIISTKNRNFEGRLYIQTTTDINPGNSGGPLFALNGEVIGVTSMGYLFLGGLNFAIPVDVVKRFIENRDAFAYDEDHPNAGYRYLQPNGRQNHAEPPATKLPEIRSISSNHRITEP